MDQHRVSTLEAKDVFSVGSGPILERKKVSYIPKATVQSQEFSGHDITAGSLIQ